MSMTPWGISQDAKQIADGIVFYMTAGHGGIRLSTERWHEFRKVFPLFEPWAGPGWLEEDEDYGRAIMVWPEFWDDSIMPSLVAHMERRRSDPYHADIPEAYWES